MSVQAQVVLPWGCTIQISPSGTSPTAHSRWVWPKAGLCTWAPRTPSWRSTMVASKTSFRRSTRSKDFLIHANTCTLCLSQPQVHTCIADVINNLFSTLTFSENTVLSLRPKASGMSTVWSMTWWPKPWNLREASSGPARTMTETYSLTL